MINYVVASSKDWFKEHPKTAEYASLNIIEIHTKDQLNLEFLKKINPRYIFFPHWNWKVDSEIYERYECIVFHTAPLPYGRGGSPVQNLILRGIENSPVCALRMTEILDGGPIYDSIEVSLDGTISEIFSRISVCVEKLIIKICQENIKPKEQYGNIVPFSRLTYEDNELKSEYSIKELFDRIRMVDGASYKNAYINFGYYKIEFSNSFIRDNELYAKVRLYRNEN
ncbi:methionyl-tRNA formyltransferase [Janthinobacterium sp. GW458P]|uniref:methionyl-tRNA formyltransferase n=1 Tax=Janthinobacterium sp. GW458P TaxID=1981504 RepID=UPI00111ED12E|nr:methionyl-tRNA formyltransferase [Janthinobacterium sp. GW458P]MBE3024362.1 methionyl-tRNA formyltransferase [Janthinobacterium sp. GW458P]